MEDKERMLGGGNVDTEEPQQDNCGKPEGGWGWVVCCGTFSVNFIVFGIHNSFGVVYEYLVDEKSMGEAETGKIKSPATCDKLLIDKTITCRMVEKLKTAYEPLVAHQARAYCGFCTMKRLRIFLPPHQGC